MRYSFTFLESQYADLTGHLFSAAPTKERAAYLLCGTSKSDEEHRLLVRRVILVPDSELLSQSGQHLSIPSRSFVAAMKAADQERAAFVFVHSHPDGVPDHSEQDDREEPGLFRTAYNRIRTPGAVHASLVLSSAALPRGRVWLDGGKAEPVELVRVLGRRFQFYFRDGFDPGFDASFFDRAVRAFGPDLLPLLRRLTIGVVGAGGTGSAVIELLIRLGVGRLIVADGQKLARSNVSRVFGSNAKDVGTAKVDLMARQATQIGLGTAIEPIEKDITYASVSKRFRDCDVIFGCTDDQWGRSILTQFALEYLVPVIDLGVKIDSEDGLIRAIPGRISTLMPGLPCLYCRGQITAEGVSAEALEQLNPTEARKRRREGYIPELPGAEPAVVAFTAGTAAFAVGEFLHRLTGFKGEDYNLSENLIRFDEGVIRKPGAAKTPGCICANQSLIGLGDRKRFLDQTWRPE
jgi:hypothetical protein